MLRRRIMLLAQAVLRRITAKRQVKTRHEATAETAPAQTIKASASFTSRNEVTVNVRSAAELKVDQKVRFAPAVRLVAYARAAMAYIKGILTPHEARLVSAPGVEAEYQKAVQLEHTAKTDVAGTTTMEARYTRFTADSEASGSTATGAITAAEMILSAEHEAKAAKASAAEVNVREALKTTHTARLVTWGDPVVVDGVLILRQVYDAEQNGEILEVS